ISREKRTNYSTFRMVNDIHKPQKELRLTATTMAGLEPILAQELDGIGAEAIKPGIRAVTFRGDRALMYRANLQLRTALRILVPIAMFEAYNEDQLYELAQKIEWSRYLSVDDTLAINTAVASKYFTHSMYIGLKLKDAIVDQFRTAFHRRPSVDLEEPTVRIHLRIQDQKCLISLDSSGRSLHLRGYRPQALEAPLNEVLAAGMIIMSGWDGSAPFVDPMCGSGTLPIEAALIATNTAPGLVEEKFGFMNWNSFDADLWKTIVDDAHAQIRQCSCPIIGSDRDAHAIDVAAQNVQLAGMQKHVTLHHAPFQDLEPIAADAGTIIINPPYGQRLEEDRIIEAYQIIGDTLKRNWPGYQAWVLSANFDAIKLLGLKPSRRVTLYNGKLECKYQKYELYQGSRKAIKAEPENPAT
ncbi:MAG: THUMP domain-containing class I SAM-dependent RNA methyltransferase, partial [Chitinivibrionales bacterium]